jgi:hypothetical protein
MSEIAPTAQCHECGEDIALTKAGLMRKHQAGEETCPGSGVEPTASGPVDDTDDAEGPPPAEAEQGGPAAPADEDEGLFDEEDEEEADGADASGTTQATEDPRAASTGWQALLSASAPAVNLSGQAETVQAPDRTSHYTGALTVKTPCPYLGDDSWHQANAQIIVRRATEAGHTPVGQPRHTDTRHNPAARTVTLTYQVRVL